MINNLSSDELRRQLDENNAAMNTLAEDNQTIVELLAQRGLQATDKTIKGPGLLVDAMKAAFKADRIVVHNALGSEVFNAAWPNPLVRPEPHETAHCMAKWPEGLAEDKESSVPLTAEELKAGGWWCDDTSEYCRLALSRKGIAIKSQSWDGRYSFFFMDNDHAYRGHVYRGLPGEKSRVTCAKKQIRRIGNNFYWGAASDQAN